MAPEIEIFGANSSVISNGTTATSTANGTDFGATFLTGALSNRTFTIRNWGTTNLEVSAVTTSGVHSNDFQIISFPSVVRPFTTSNLDVRFDPSALGSRTAVVTVANNDADEGSYSFAVAGTGIPDGSYIRLLGGASLSTPITNGSAAVTNTLGTDFGVQYLTGFSTSRTFAVSNAGNSTLNISAVNLSGAHAADFQVVSFPATVAVGAKTNLVIQFDPLEIGARTATVEIASDGVGMPIYTFAVGGVGVPDTPEILVLGTNLQSILDGNMTVSGADGTYFGGTAVSSGSIDRVFTVTNSGAVDLILSNVTFQGSGAPHFSAPAVPPVVTPGTGSNLTIRFSPATAGVITAVVAIANNDVDENPYEFTVRGDGISTHYVWTNSPSPTPPYLSWETAAHTIQTAATICVDGDVIWVTNGVYTAGSASGNRVNLTNAVRLGSVNGPEVTIIDGAGTLRCVYLGNNAALSGFTITNGYAGNGGGVYGQNNSAVVSNCVISGNAASGDGGGIYYATTYDSLISGNTAVNGGGGAAYATLHRCRLIGNQAGGNGTMNCCYWDPYMMTCMQWANELYGGGGGSYQCTLLSSLLLGNSANAGGGASFSDLVNCTLVSNQAAGLSSWSLGGGGMINGSAVNCVFVGNSDLSAPSKGDWDTYSSCYGSGISITYSCLTNPPSGIGNVTGRATFVSGTYRLATGSPGIDAGDNASVQGATDLDGQPRIANMVVDMGAYEFAATAPLIAMDPIRVSLVVKEGQSAPDRSVDVWNGGIHTLDYLVASNVPWISVHPGSGSSTGEHDVITLSLATTGLATGSYTGLVTFSSTNAGNSPQSCEVSLTVIPLVLDHFAWSQIASPQQVGIPLAASITAKDAENITVARFTNTVSLTGWRAEGVVYTNIGIGTGTASVNYPMGTYFHDQRTQVIYLTNEIGAACTITSLAVNVTTIPGQVMSNWTIRLKHTPMNAYPASPIWEGSGWTTVYQTNESRGTTGWRTYNFNAPFEYNGTNNLMVDFSFNNSSYTSDGRCEYSSASTNRAITYQTDSGYGDPLTWSGTSPSTSPTVNVPNIRLGAIRSDFLPVPISPAIAGPFAAGAWNGTITVDQAANDLFLLASYGAGPRGDSNYFDVISPVVDTDGDGIPDDWEAAHGLNPAVSNSPTMNSDGDDQSDIDEYVADTQPTNGASYFPLVVLTNPPLGTMVLVVDPTSTARVYGVRWTTNLLATPQIWTLLLPEQTGTGSAVTFMVTNDGPGRIYRTGVRLP